MAHLTQVDMLSRRKPMGDEKGQTVMRQSNERRKSPLYTHPRSGGKKAADDKETKAEAVAEKGKKAEAAESEAEKAKEEDKAKE